MLVFDIIVNGKPRCRAGVPNGVLTAIATWVGPVDSRGKARRESLDLHVGGLVHPDEHVTWLDERLKRGDRVTIEILESGEAHEPRVRKRPPRPDPANQPKLELAKGRTRRSR